MQSGRPKAFGGPVLACVATACLAAMPVSANLVFNNTFGSSITSLGNAAAIENTILNAEATYMAVLADPITVNLDFEDMGGGLGMSSTSFFNISYLTYCNALKADAKTASDATANISLGACGATNPVNGAWDD
jgi:hypothetical protein